MDNLSHSTELSFNVINESNEVQSSGAIRLKCSII